MTRTFDIGVLRRTRQSILSEDRGFVYKYWGEDEEGELVDSVDHLRDCGTAGCVAGHIVFSASEDEIQRVVEAYAPTRVDVELAAIYLLLGEVLSGDMHNVYADKSRLFEACSGYATREDALARIDYLIEHDTLEGYDWNSESYVEKGESDET